MTFPVPHVSPYESPIVVTYLGTNGTGLSIGAARTDRYIVAIGYSENDSAGQMTDCQFDGVSGTIIDNPSRSDTFGMAYKQITTGTTVTVSVSQFGLARTEFYMVTGAKNGYFGKGTNSSGGTTLTCSPSTPASKSAIIMGSISSGSSGSFGVSQTGGAQAQTLNNSGNIGGGGNPAWWASSGLGDKSGTTANITHSGSSAYSSGYGCAAVFY